MPGSAILEYWPEQFGNSNDGVPDFDVKERSAENFGHNIGNPNLWKTRFKHNNENSVKSEPSLDFEISIAKTRDELIAANDRHLNICNTFWRPSLSMNQYIHGDPAVEFDTLWPDNSSLKDLLQDGIQNTALRAAISDMTYISVICGPPYMIKYSLS
ncbi:hypothetical protein KUTeg_001981 [Tegillarca granosa]|uniref:Uncharacterized protein n=1 Tax=Tegillarca granosa TaxID=220873 RepID=A0ABQ9FT01_TEGGR|nr:hypothetical protein KUTeg_001981 [Tegillarca granosa]